jgi:hypothetical protein
VILIERDQRLLNQCGVTLVNLAKHGHVKAIECQAFIDRFVRPRGSNASQNSKSEGSSSSFQMTPRAGPMTKPLLPSVIGPSIIRQPPYVQSQCRTGKQ